MLIHTAVIISWYLPEKQYNVNQCAATPRYKTDAVCLTHPIIFTHSSKTYVYLHVISKITLPSLIKDLFQDIIKTIKRNMEIDISKTIVQCTVRETAHI